MLGPAGARGGGWGPGGGPPAGGTEFELFGERFRSPLAGEHNVLNATAALTLARELGAPLPALVAGLHSFPGAGRRMELITDTAGAVVYDDYGDHPAQDR